MTGDFPPSLLCLINGHLESVLKCWHVFVGKTVPTRKQVLGGSSIALKYTSGIDFIMMEVKFVMLKLNNIWGLHQEWPP